MKRREFITLLGVTAAAWPLVARAQQAAKISRVGYIRAGTPNNDQVREEFVRGMRDLGYVKGRNITCTSEVAVCCCRDSRRVISSSPGELGPVFNAMLENAVHICEANFGNLFLSKGDAFRIVALQSAPPAWAER
jgi:hypothetical protein